MIDMFTFILETSYSDNDTSEGELSDPSSPDISSSSSQSSIGPVVDVVITSPSPVRQIKAIFKKNCLLTVSSEKTYTCM